MEHIDSIDCDASHRRLATALICGLIATLSGCADLTTFNRHINLNGQSAVAMDVKQRIVFSTKSKDGKHVVTCAEPSPDALTVISASGGLSISPNPADAGKGINAALALSESGAFVGLRTQSIQLLRDAMYRLCEAYASGGIDTNEYEGMQRRYQSSMMGLIAIEQLTKPVVAGQALLISASSSQAGAGAGDAVVTAAQTRVDAQRQKVLDSENDHIAKVAKLASARKALTENIAAANNATDDASRAALVELKPDLIAAVEDAQLSAAAAARQLALERQTLQQALAALQQAQSKAGAMASGGGSLGDIAGATSKSSASLSRAVVEIVGEVNRSYVRDECFNLFSRVVFAERAAIRQREDLERKANTTGQRLPTEDTRSGTLGVAQLDAALVAFSDAKELCRTILTAEITDQIRSHELKIAQNEVKVIEARIALVKAEAAANAETLPPKEDEAKKNAASKAKRVANPSGSQPAKK